MLPPEIVKKINDLVKLLRQQTLQGLITWDATGEGNAPSFITSASGTSIALKSRDDDGSQPYLLRIIDSKGVNTYSIETDVNEGEAAVNDAIEDLYHTVNSDPSRAIRALDQAIKNFNDVPPF